MTRVQLVQLAPLFALGALSLAFVAYLVWALRKRALARRPILLVSMLLAAAPAFYVALTWTRLIDEQQLRIERPALAYPVAFLIVVAAQRLLGLSERQHATRRALTELLIMASALGAGLATIGL